MKKILFILTAFIFSSFSLSAQWTCETLDPEFDDAMKIAYIHDKNGNGLTIGEYCSIWQYNNWVSQQLSIADFLFNLLEYDYTGQYDWINTVSDMKDALKAGAFPDSWVDFTSEAGNIPVVLAVEGKYYCGEDDYCSVYSFEISFKIGESYKKYRNYSMSERMIPLDEDEIVVSYEYDRKDRVGNYYIEWPSKEFWKDFRAASSVKFRIKQSAKSEYQYYEFNMSGSTKAFNYVTTNHKVVWLEDWIEEFIKEQKEQKEQKEAERQREIEMEEAELQKELASVTPPHKLKFECTERSLHLIYPDFYLYPLSDSVSCGTREDLEYYEEYDTILNVMGLCPCLNGAIEAMENIGEDDRYNSNYDLNKYSKSVGWNLDGIHVWSREKWESDKLVREVVVPFNDISQYDWGERYCAFLKETLAGHFIASGSFEIDTITKYQISWTQNPLKLIISEKNRAKEYTVVDWSAEKEWESGEYRYYRWSYNILSDDGKQYVVRFKREVDEQRALEAGWTLWETNIGQELLFDHWQIPSNIFFRHTTIQDEENYLEIIK